MPVELLSSAKDFATFGCADAALTALSPSPPEWLQTPPNLSTMRASVQALRHSSYERAQSTCSLTSGASAVPAQHVGSQSGGHMKKIQILAIAAMSSGVA